MIAAPLIAGLELGGTKCVALLATGPGDVREHVTVPTNDPETTLSALEAALDGWGFDAIGVGSFGPLELNAGHPDFGAITATTKPGWTGTHIARRIAARYAKPLAIQTDVNGAALAEARWGAAQGLTSHAYITIGTGVGGRHRHLLAHIARAGGEQRHAFGAAQFESGDQGCCAHVMALAQHGPRGKPPKKQRRPVS